MGSDRRAGKHVDRHVARNGQQPRRDGSASRVVRRSVLPCTHEALLSCFLGGATVAEDRERQAEDPMLKPPHEVTGSIRIARP